MMRVFFTGIFVLSCLFLSGCGGKNHTMLAFDHVGLEAEGPLLAGANTLQGEISPNLKSFAEKHGIDSEDIQSVHLKSATLSAVGNNNLDLMSAITIQLVSDETNMVKLALINPIPAGSKSIKLTIATDQEDLLEILQQDNITVIADAIFVKDHETRVELRVDFEFELIH